jgi:hypothetical protein
MIVGGDGFGRLLHAHIIVVFASVVQQKPPVFEAIGPA